MYKAILMSILFGVFGPSFNANAQINKCRDSTTNETVYTDKPCDIRRGYVPIGKGTLAGPAPDEVVPGPNGNHPKLRLGEHDQLPFVGERYKGPAAPAPAVGETDPNKINSPLPREYLQAALSKAPKPGKYEVIRRWYNGRSIRDTTCLVSKGHVEDAIEGELGGNWIPRVCKRSRFTNSGSHFRFFYSCNQKGQTLIAQSDLTISQDGYRSSLHVIERVPSDYIHGDYEAVLRRIGDC